MMSKERCPAAAAAAEETLSQQSESSSSLTSSIPVEVTVEKYQRLAGEYAKLRAQFQVLRKAVVEEQAANQDAQQSLRAQDQNVRRLEQERESLLFRNQQLTKRVAVLQAELEPAPQAAKSRFFSLGARSKEQQQPVVETSGTPDGHGGDNDTAGGNTNLVELLSQQLKAKMEENELLRQTAERLEEERTRDVDRWQHELRVTHQDAERCLEQQQNRAEQLQASLSAAQIEQNRLVERCQRLEEEVCHARTTVHNLMEENKALKETTNTTTTTNMTVSGKSPVAVNKKVAASAPGGTKSYQDANKRQEVIEQLAAKLSVFLCALSTLHSNLAQKISILFALYNKGSNHLYFRDFSADIGLATGAEQSLSVMSILRKLRDHLKMGYDTYLVHLEDAINQYCELKVRCTADHHHGDPDDCKELNATEQELAETSIEIVGTFADYVSYLNKLSVYLAIMLNLWCKQFREYQPPSGGNGSEQQAGGLADCDNRTALCQKNEMLMHSVTACVRCIGHICNHVQLLLSKSSDFLTAFNQFMHRVEALEKCLEETKRVFSSKVALEHAMGVTTEPDLKSMDDCILSSLVFVSKCVQEIRVMLETHYFFFVDHPPPPLLLLSNSPVAAVTEPEADGEEDPSPPPPSDDAAGELKLCQDRLDQERERCAQMEARCRELMDQLQLQQQHQKPKLQANAAAAAEADLLEAVESAEARAMAYRSDCQALRQRLAVTVEQHQQLERRLQQQEAEEEKLREEYRTAVDNYETQLQAMSEHMATLNERLTDQRDQIDALKLDQQQQPQQPASGGGGAAVRLGFRRSFIARR